MIEIEKFKLLELLDKTYEMNADLIDLEFPLSNHKLINIAIEIEKIKHICDGSYIFSISTFLDIYSIDDTNITKILNQTIIDKLQVEGISLGTVKPTSVVQNMSINNFF